jgi:hypothetical protein
MVARGRVAIVALHRQYGKSIEPKAVFMRTEYQEKLFRKHADDLRSVCGIIEPMFVCPLCLRGLSYDELKDELMNVGHVWPRSLRQKSKVAQEQHVLLCRRCNSLAGMNADAEMQEYERVSEGILANPAARAGIVHVFVPTRPGLKHIKFRGTIQANESLNKAHIILEDPKSEKQKANYQIILSRIQDYAKLGPISAAVELSVDPYLAQAGWLTSAYLFAFYSFGYRYILHRELDPIRHSILQSFSGAVPVSDLLSPQTEKQTFVMRKRGYNYVDPEIRLFVTRTAEVPNHIQIYYLSVHVRLPFPILPGLVDWGSDVDSDEITGGFIDLADLDLPTDLYWGSVFAQPTWSIPNHPPSLFEGE